MGREYYKEEFLFHLLSHPEHVGGLFSGDNFIAANLGVKGRFVKTRTITVEVFDRSNPEVQAGRQLLHRLHQEGMLRDHNVKVSRSCPRWTEVEVLNNLLAAGDAPDICVTYSYPTILAYANMGGCLT